MPQNFDNQPLSWSDCAFFFVFCPNNSGTTILCQYLASQLNAYLPPFGNAEGQMAPAVKPMMREDSWNPEHAYDWSFIRTQWEALSEGALFVEGSPPNLVRVAGIHDVFGKDSTALISISDPYQHIASSFRRYAKTGSNPTDWVDTWVQKATAIRDTRETYPHLPFLSHEQFVSDPETMNRLLAIDPVPFEGDGKKGSDAKGIEDLSGRTIAFLDEAEIDAVSVALAPHEDLVASFGYELQSGVQKHARLRDANAPEYEKGRVRRSEWSGPVDPSTGLLGTKSPLRRFAQRARQAVVARRK